MTIPSLTDASDWSDLGDDVEDVAHLGSPLATLSRTQPKFLPRAHQKIISDAIVAAKMGIGPTRICVSVPPQFGKSTVTSVGAPMWWIELHTLGQVEGGLVGLVSYEDKLAMSWSKKIWREFEARPDLFETRLRKDSKAASFWETTTDGGVIAVGVSGTIVGRPISLLVIDDPTKNYEQANSERHREMVWDFWQAVGVGRLQPWTIVIVTMTRWREDDLIGRLLAPADQFPGDPDEWSYIHIPAVCESDDDPLGREIGEPLLRPQADQTVEDATRELIKVKASISSYHWNTLWQQNPSDPEGAIFSPRDFRYYSDNEHDSDRVLYRLPDDFDQVIMLLDCTFKDTKTSDWVVGGVIGAKGPNRYLLDLIRGHWGLNETCKHLRDLIERTRRRFPIATRTLVEDKANGPAVIETMQSEVSGVEPWPEKGRSMGSKEARGWACQPLVKGGYYYLPSKDIAPWVEDYVKELGDFPSGSHDDQVDMTTMGLIFLNQNSFEPVTVLTHDDVDLSRISLLGR